MDFSKIKDLLTDKRLTMKTLSDKIGMSRGGLHTAIANKTLTIEALEKIAEALEVPVTYFFESGSSDEIEFLRSELEKAKENLSIQGGNYGDLQYQYDNLLNISKLNEKVAESATKEALAYHNLISMFYEEFVWLLRDYYLYVCEDIIKQHPEVKNSNNSDLINKYLDENLQLKKLIKLKDKIEPVVDKKVLARIEDSRKEVWGKYNQSLTNSL